MSQINHFAKDLIIRQYNIFQENKSTKYDMSQPLGVLFISSIVLFSDYKEQHNSESLIGSIARNDDTNDNVLKKFIETFYETQKKLNYRLEKYCESSPSNSYLNEKYKEYEVFFYDLRNSMAHLVETNKGIYCLPDGNNDFSKIKFKVGRKTLSLSKEEIVNVIDIINKLISI